MGALVTNAMFDAVDSYREEAGLLRDQADLLEILANDLEERIVDALDQEQADAFTTGDPGDENDYDEDFNRDNGDTIMWGT